MPTLLLTGFDIWGPHTHNSSWEMLREAAPAVPGWQVVTAQLPVSWARAPRLLEQQLTPEVQAVVCFGMNGGEKLLVERIAVNLAAPRAKDVDGLLPSSDLLVPEGPAAYWTGLPHQEVLSALTEADLPCAESHHAGTYLCNCTFYWLMHHVATRRPDLTGGFIHVPPEQGMPTEVLRRAVEPIAQVVTACAAR